MKLNAEVGRKLQQDLEAGHVGGTETVQKLERMGRAWRVCTAPLFVWEEEVVHVPETVLRRYLYCHRRCRHYLHRCRSRCGCEIYYETNTG
jgi:hypothetical protein